MKHENCTVELSSNRLILSKDCVTLLNITAGERLSIMYYQIDNQTTIPLIGKSSCFTDENDGNRLTKSNTVSFRGQQNEVLKLYGNFFYLEDFKNGVYKLISVKTEE